MTFGRRYSWVNNKYVSVIQEPPKQKEYQELCSIANNKDNYALLENTPSQTGIISKGFFQTAAQKALQSSQIEKAFEIAEQYIETSKRKFYRFLDVNTKKIIISSNSTALILGISLPQSRNSEGSKGLGLDTTSCT